MAHCYRCGEYNPHRAKYCMYCGHNLAVRSFKFAGSEMTFYLKKPVCVFTDKQFFERYYNGLAVQHQGFGLVEESFSRAKLHEFFSRQQEFKKNLWKANVQPANQQIIDKIEQLVQQLKK